MFVRSYKVCKSERADQQRDKVMKLNLGCGGDLISGYLNIDLHRPEKSRSGISSDEFEFHIGDVSDLSFIPDGSCAEIRAKDILDHITYKNLALVIEEWIKKLKPNGVLLLLVVPDFQYIFDQYSSGRSHSSWLKLNQWVDRFSFPEERYRTKNIIDYEYLKMLVEGTGMAEHKHWHDDDGNVNIEFTKK